MCLCWGNRTACWETLLQRLGKSSGAEKAMAPPRLYFFQRVASGGGGWHSRQVDTRQQSGETHTHTHTHSSHATTLGGGGTIATSSIQYSGMQWWQSKILFLKISAKCPSEPATPLSRFHCITFKKCLPTGHFLPSLLREARHSKRSQPNLVVQY